MLGPFYDPDGEEILPATTEATGRIVELALGTYRITSNVLTLADRTFRVTPGRLTRYIQDDWNQVSSGKPRKGFLLAYQGSAAAAGRMMEGLIAVAVLQRLRGRADRPQVILIGG